VEVMDAIKERRSIRQYLSDPVTDQELRAVLEAARWAPSWANTQAWEFVVVKDAPVKQALSQTLTPNNPSTDAVRTAPVVIAAVGRRDLSGFKKDGPLTKAGDWYMFDLGLAIQNLTLAAFSLGLGTVHVGAMDLGAAEKILEIPEGYSLVELIPLGRPASDSKAPPRKELSEFLHKDKFGSPWEG